MAIVASALGFPRIGPRRELKKTLENYWSGVWTAQTLFDKGAELRAAN
jgi:5-methyltetrahydropteroyltriglutamate--homocysteine methyltransferase